MKFSCSVDFKIGDPVYVKADPLQARYCIRGYIISEHEVWYEIKNRDGELDHYYGFELSSEEDTNLRISSVQ